MIAQVALVDTEFGVHDRAGLQYGHSSVEKGGIRDENLEERCVGRMKSIKVNSFHEDGGTDKPGVGGGGITFDRECNSVVEG